jgi:acetyl esterase/lipase
MDPRWFHGEADPSTVELVRRIEAYHRDHPHLTSIRPDVARQAREEGRSVFGPLSFSDRATWASISGPDSRIDLRVFPVTEPEAVYLHLHGGGWVLGGPHHQDRRLQTIADRCNVAVVSVDYRLAPEDPYPAGPDDCETAAVWLVHNAADEFGTDRLLIGGESAGAHLAAVTLLRMRDRHSYTGFLAANLVYGVFDLRLTPSARLWGDRTLVLDTPSLYWFRDHFLPDPSMADHPDVSPLLADLTGLPPALFTVGSADPLLDDTLFMYGRWVAAGNRAGLAVYPGAPHAFDAFDVPVADTALDRICSFISAALG